MTTPGGDLIFISHNSADAAVAETIARWIEDRQATPCWLDLWDILPGRPWQEELERALEQSTVALILIGSAGLGPWQREETRIAIDMRVRAPNRKLIIPVLLPGADVGTTDFPRFLRRLSWLDMRKDISDDVLQLLTQAIKGEVRRNTPPVIRTEPADAALSLNMRQALVTVERSILGVRRWAQQIQNTDGGLPSDKEGSYSCTWSTAGLLWSVWEAGESFRQLWMRRALTWVLDNTNDDGGIPIVAKGDPSITDATAQTLLACAGCVMETAGERYARSMRTLAEWLVFHQEDGGWGWRPGVEHCWTASTVFSLLALRACRARIGGNLAEIDEALEAGVQWILSARNPDSGWGSHKGDSSRPAVTGLTMFALAELGHGDQAQISVNYLLQEFAQQNRWITTIDRPYRHTVTRFGDAYGLLGLLSYLDDMDCLEFRKGFEALMRSFKYPYFQYEQSVMHTWPTRDGLLVMTQIARRLGSTITRARPSDDLW